MGILFAFPVSQARRNSSPCQSYLQHYFPLFRARHWDLLKVYYTSKLRAPPFSWVPPATRSMTATKTDVPHLYLRWFTCRRWPTQVFGSERGKGCRVREWLRRRRKRERKEEAAWRTSLELHCFLAGQLQSFASFLSLRSSFSSLIDMSHPGDVSFSFLLVKKFNHSFPSSPRG